MVSAETRHLDYPPTNGILETKLLIRAVVYFSVVV